MSSDSSILGVKTAAGPSGESDYDRRLAHILEHATAVFYEKGYAAASMRDLSRATGMSLAGIYHYFDSKERLLYAIQKHNFETILQRLQERLQRVREPEQRLRVFIENHVEYFLANTKGMKVLSHENNALHDSLGAEIRHIKRKYYETCRDLIDELQQQRNLNVVPTRVAVLSLFGMINWIYTWHNPQVDVDATGLARQMGDLFLRGLVGTRENRRPRGVKRHGAARGEHAMVRSAGT